MPLLFPSSWTVAPTREGLFWQVVVNPQRIRKASTHLLPSGNAESYKHVLLHIYLTHTLVECTQTHIQEGVSALSQTRIHVRIQMNAGQQKSSGTPAHRGHRLASF